MTVFEQKWLYSGKRGCIWSQLLCSGKSSCIRAKWLYLSKVVVFGQSACIGANWLNSGKSGYIREK